MALLGISMFSLHYLFVYAATQYIVSGIIAVVFSGVSFLTIANNTLFFRTKPKFNIVVGALIGMVGLCVFFWHELANISMQQATLKGLTLSGIGAAIFSLGSVVSKRNNNHGLAIVSAMTMGMVYGAIAMFVYILVTGTPFVMPTSPVYWASLLYLVVPGSIIAFLCYLQLIKNIGPELTSYTSILFPVVALIISSLCESYQWSSADLCGLLLVFIGNACILPGARKHTSHQ